MGKQNDLAVIATLIEEAAEYGLEAEVIYTAIKHAQEDADISPAQAIQIGMDEWIK
jgi:hypothetical protein